jgi:hypothetical protein
VATRSEIAAVAPSARRSDQESTRDWFPLLLALLWLALASAAAWPGLRYYGLPLSERVFAEQHTLFAPTGRIGHGFGVLGSGMMLFGVLMYAVRKRWHALARWGKLKHWLQFHIFLCTLGPFFILLHTSFKIGGLVSIAFWSMTLVVLSGIFGRYVYARIPKSVNGQFRTLQDLEQENKEIAAQLAKQFTLSRSDLLQLGLLATASTPTLLDRSDAPFISIWPRGAARVLCANTWLVVESPRTPRRECVRWWIGRPGCSSSSGCSSPCSGSSVPGISFISR